MLAGRSLAYQRRSDGRPVAAATAVFLGDSMGELYAYYAACDLAFIGGSLLPLGGQNLLEACAMGKPVIVGPHTFNFDEATRLAVGAGAALQVRDDRELGSAIAELLGNGERRRQMGQAGLALVRQHQGAAQRILALLQPASRR
jgi:3-deoxy-D-manno-octulosonic-acid transferase